MSRKYNKTDNVRRAAFAGMLAAAAGYVAGLLTAPKSGKETRSDIKAAADRGLAEAEKDLKNLHTELGKIIDEAKLRGDKLGDKAQKQLTKLVDKAQDTKEKAREMLSALHEGDAEDQDLKRAIINAKRARDNLSDYLKK